MLIYEDDCKYDARYLYGNDMPRGQKARKAFHTWRLLVFLFSVNSDPDRELAQTDYIGRDDLLHAAKTRMPLIESCGLLPALGRLRRYDAAIISENRVLQEHQRQLARCVIKGGVR
jgi:hypothetical protein